jgi:hypothetical protein
MELVDLAVRRARKLARKQAHRDGLLLAPKKRPEDRGAARPAHTVA